MITGRCGFAVGGTGFIPVPRDHLLLGRTVEGVGLLDDEHVSERHARVRRTPWGIEVEDLGSTNGTWLGSRRITVSIIPNGAVVRLGSTLLTALVPADPDADRYADPTSQKKLVDRWEELKRAAPDPRKYLDYFRRHTGVPESDLRTVRDLRNSISHESDRYHSAHEIVWAMRVISKVSEDLDRAQRSPSSGEASNA